jgi:hypothetical protein
MTIPLFAAGSLLTANELNDALGAAGALPMTQPNTWAGAQTFNRTINQSPGAGANNETPFAQYGDLFHDAMLAFTAPATSSTLSSTLPAATVYVLGQRVVIPDTPFTVTASATSYLDLSNTGVLTVSTSSTVTANSLRLWSVVSSSTAITGVTRVARINPMTESIGYNVLDYGADPTGGADSTSAIQAAINAANDISVLETFGPATSKSVYFPNGIYLVSSQITVYNNVTLVAEQGSGARITTSMSSGYLIQFVSENSTGTLSSDKQFSKAMVGPFHLINTDASNTASAMLLGGSTSSQGACAQTVFDTVAIEGFSLTHTYGFNAYLITFLNCNFYGFKSNGSISILGSVSNSGEKLTYIGCVFWSSNGPALLGLTLEFMFIGCSFDYMGPGSGNGMLINGGGDGASYTFSQCHFEWAQASSLLVVNLGASYLNISNCSFWFTGTSGAPDGLMFLGTGPFNVTVKNNKYYTLTVFPYMYEVGSGVSGVLDVDEPDTIVPSSIFTNYINGSLPSGVAYFTQRSMPSLNITNESTLTGTTAGTITSTMPQQGIGKVFQAYASGYENDTATDQTITFPTAFANPPYIAHNGTGLTISASTTALTITAPNATTLYSGNIEVRGM